MKIVSVPPTCGTRLTVTFSSGIRFPRDGFSLALIPPLFRFSKRFLSNPPQPAVPAPPFLLFDFSVLTPSAAFFATVLCGADFRPPFLIALYHVFFVWLRVTSRFVSLNYCDSCASPTFLLDRVFSAVLVLTLGRILLFFCGVFFFSSPARLTRMSSFTSLLHSPSVFPRTFFAIPTVPLFLWALAPSELFFSSCSFRMS